MLSFVQKYRALDSRSCFLVQFLVPKIMLFGAFPRGKKPCSRSCYLVVLSFVPIKIVLWIQPSITAIRLVPSDVDLFAARTSWNYFRIMSVVGLGPKEYMYIWYRIYIWWLFVGGKSDKLSATLGCVLAAAWWFVSLFFCKGSTVNIVLSNCAYSSKFSTWKK